jgi:hypothetical protein
MGTVCLAVRIRGVHGAESRPDRGPGP